MMALGFQNNSSPVLHSSQSLATFFQCRSIPICCRSFLTPSIHLLLGRPFLFFVHFRMHLLIWVFFPQLFSLHDSAIGFCLILCISLCFRFLHFVLFPCCFVSPNSFFIQCSIFHYLTIFLSNIFNMLTSAFDSMSVSKYRFHSILGTGLIRTLYHVISGTFDRSFDLRSVMLA